ncbi:MAG: sulfatase-like hydrolase/transferase [Planctomycetales bacterium]|nr:sulfatase-like hydrolase/transferase [Planctomycetales bacterium]MCA9180917.1 sulfatase-like hydrolase/transferase [Planctomycetales bacterium]
MSLISRFALILFCQFFVFAVARTNAADQPPASAKRPNVIIFYTDDQGSLDANCYGSQDLVTPTIDGLAATGVRFTQMYAPSAICSSSRAGLMTGRFPARAGVAHNVSDKEGTEGLPHNELTIANMLQDAGYRTAHIGKWHLGHRAETRPNGQGFDFSFGHMQGCIDNYSHFFYWNGPNRHDLWLNDREIYRDGEYFGDLMRDYCKQFISQESEQPFFVYMAINWPHYPLQGSKKWRDHYAQRIADPNRQRYAALLSTADELIGDIVAHIDSLGLRENTLIVYQSDHGHSVEERAFGGGGNPGPYRGCKGSLFEGGLRIPSVVSWPGTIPANETREQAVFGCDWLPTIADYVGCKPASEKLDGKSIRSVIESKETKSPHEHLYWLLGRGPQAQWAVRQGNWKLLGNPKDPRQPNSLGKDDDLFLVDLSDDISESKNVAAMHPDRVEQLQAIHTQYLAEIESR